MDKDMTIRYIATTSAIVGALAMLLACVLDETIQAGNTFFIYIMLAIIFVGIVGIHYMIKSVRTKSTSEKIVEYLKFKSKKRDESLLN